MKMKMKIRKTHHFCTECSDSQQCAVGRRKKRYEMRRQHSRAEDDEERAQQSTADERRDTEHRALRG